VNGRCRFFFSAVVGGVTHRLGLSLWTRLIGRLVVESDWRFTEVYVRADGEYGLPELDQLKLTNPQETGRQNGVVPARK
jgi:hypothetical protein